MMAPMREFTTKAPSDRKRPKKKSVVFTLDGSELRAVQPKNAAMLSLANADEGDDMAKVRAFVKFMNDVLDGPSRAILSRRMDDPDDDLDLDSDVMAELMEFLVEELIETEDPTGSPSPSTGARASTGGRSGARSRSTA